MGLIFAPWKIGEVPKEHSLVKHKIALARVAYNNNNNNNNSNNNSNNKNNNDFLCEVGRRLSVVSGDPRETSFLFQRLSFDTALQFCSD